MGLFTSNKEKRLWFYTLLVCVAIFSTLIIGKPLVKVFTHQNTQAALFMVVMLLISITVLVYGLRKKPKKIEWVIIIGITAVFIMLLLRLNISERSHLLEYSVLAIFVHKALSERLKHRKKASQIKLWAILITALIGILDESIQIFIPYRVFDVEDIVFNVLAVTMVIVAVWVLEWAKQKTTKSNRY